MSNEVHYLELSENDGVSHKFYEERDKCWVTLFHDVQ
jgi:hypothetical protein